jgi:hypothetical protein
MGVSWRSDADYHKTFGLDAQERETAAGSPPGEHTEAERAVGNQESVLQELMRTKEPTAEAAALLEDLRRKVARAVAERN